MAAARACSCLLVLSALLHCPPDALAAGVEGYRMKINAVDTSRAPELSIFFTLLNPKDQPIPAKKVNPMLVRVNGKEVERAAEIYSLKGSPHAVAVAMVACGYQACAGPLAKAQGKGFEELAKGFRDQDRAAAFAYLNNAQDLTKGVFVPGATAAAAVGAIQPSEDAFQAKLLDTLRLAVRIFQAYDKELPANRFIVLLSDGADSSSENEDAAGRKIFTIVKEAKKARVRIMALGYSDSGDAFLGNLEILARKSGGTYRRARNLKDIPLLFKYVVAEIWGQLVVDAVPDLKEKREFSFVLSGSYRGKQIATSQQAPFVTRIDELHFRWKYWAKVGAIVLGVLLLLLAILLVVRKILKKRKKAKELAELKAPGKVGDVVQMEAPPGLGDAKKTAEAGAKAAAGGKKAAAGGAKAAAAAGGAGAKAAAGGA
ncbi:MAG: hypothetical protein FJ125_08140, partial [Deltaproteobacteria bacterium]|nr:hypothetical protein [Deltaproteobacteria bacterium]